MENMSKLTKKKTALEKSEFSALIIRLNADKPSEDDIKLWNEFLGKS
jgi:hypothetical protein